MKSTNVDVNQPACSYARESTLYSIPGLQEEVTCRKEVSPGSTPWDQAKDSFQIIKTTRKLLLLLSSFLFSFMAYAQEDGRYVAIIKMKNGERIKGFMTGNDGHCLLLVRSSQQSVSNSWDHHLTELPIAEIQSIKVKRKGSVARAAGATALFCAGIALETSLEYPSLKHDLTMIAASGMLGALMGALVESFTPKKKYKIKGSLQNFESCSEELAKYYTS